MGGLCQVPKIMYTISYAFNIALLIIFIVITTTEQLFECICLLSRMLKNLRSCVLLQGFTNFSVDPYYDPLSLVMIIHIFLFRRATTNLCACFSLNLLAYAFYITGQLCDILKVSFSNPFTSYRWWFHHFSQH